MSEFSGPGQYQQFKAQKEIDHSDRMREAASKIDEQAVDAQLEILERLFTGKSQSDINALRAHSIQDNELNRQALAKWDELYGEKSEQEEVGVAKPEVTLTD